MSEDQIDTETYANDSATSSSIDTELAQPRSPSVHAFDVEATRRFLIAERVLAGAKSAIGHRCSNLIEQIKNYQTAADPAQRAYLEASIRRSVAEIQAIKYRRAIEAQRLLAAQ